MDLTLWHYLLLAVLGIIASIINILAGGGSNLILPVLMMMGVPPDIANGSNRIGVFLQTITGIRGFAGAGRIPPARELWPIMLPTLLGGLFGAVLASVLPATLLKPTLLLSMLFVAGWVVFKPDMFAVKPEGEPKKITLLPWLWLFVVGIYGGFVQAGVGLLMLPVFAGVLCYDLVRSNALKLICTFGFTTLAVTIFLIQGQIWWHVAVPLAIGNIIGAMVGVKIAMNIPANVMRWGVFVMTLCAVTLALYPQ